MSVLILPNFANTHKLSCILVNSRVVTGTFDDESLPSAPGATARLRAVGIIARVWLADGSLNTLTVEEQWFLFRMHLVAIGEGTWPHLPAPLPTLAKLLQMNPRPVERLLNLLMPAFVQRVQVDDQPRLLLRDLDALIRWRPLNELG